LFCAGEIRQRSVRRTAPDAKLIADPADFALGKIDFDHILRRADQAHGLVGMSVEDLGGVIAVLIGGDITDLSPE
jgi:hypothetical protein